MNIIWNEWWEYIELEEVFGWFNAHSMQQRLDYSPLGYIDFLSLGNSNYRLDKRHLHLHWMLKPSHVGLLSNAILLKQCLHFSSGEHKSSTLSRCKWNKLPPQTNRIIKLGQCMHLKFQKQFGRNIQLMEGAQSTTFILGFVKEIFICPFSDM